MPTRNSGASYDAVDWRHITRSDGHAALFAVARPAVVLTEFASGRRRLTAAELDRARRMRSTDHRDAFVAAHVLVRAAAARMLGMHLDDLWIEQACRHCGLSGHGRPELRSRAPLDTTCEITFSHTTRHVMAAAATTRIGVDLEDRSSRVPLDLLALTPEEQASLADVAEPNDVALRWWTRKEAMVKLGIIEINDFGSVDARPDVVSFDAGPAAELLSIESEDWVASVALPAQ